MNFHCTHLKKGLSPVCPHWETAKIHLELYTVETVRYLLFLPYFITLLRSCKYNLNHDTEEATHVCIHPLIYRRADTGHTF